MPRAIVRIGRKSNIFYIGINPIAVSNSGYYIYTTDLSRIPIPSYCLRVYI